ncbi:hypothetical protein ACB092_01G141300 [Castanea dentata]
MDWTNVLLLGFHVGLCTLRHVKDSDFYPYLLEFFFNCLYFIQGQRKRLCA